MKTTIKVEKEIEITYIEMTLPVRFGEEDIPNNFPLRRGDVWSAKVIIDTGEIVDWPNDPNFQKCRLHLKVCDEGQYALWSYSGDSWEIVAHMESDYVPHGVIPGEYGNYVILRIENGKITNWPKKPDVSKFFKG